MATASTVSHKRRTPRAFSAFAETGHSYRAKYYKQVQKDAREKFTQEISFRSKDKDISPAKALLHVATEDEAFMAFNREMDAYSIQNETKSTSLSSESLESTYGAMPFPLAGKNMNEWMSEFDAIADEVEAELISRETRRNLVEVLDAVNTVLFKSRGFKRSSVPMDSKCSYLHSVLSSGYCSAILLSVVYIEVCRRLNVTILGSRIGEDFLIWPQTRNPEELFKITSCHSLFGIVNGKCANDPRTKASDIDSSSLSGLEIATIRDIIGIALANLIRLHWKCASRSNHGLMLTSHLRSSGSFSKNDSSNVHLLRPQDLRLAIMASERLLILQPHNWSLRRDHGMMLYYSREYEEAVKELSICMAFAPEEESEILEVFVEKLHYLCVESSWNKSLGHKGHLSIP
ncbi:LOW QUALITY PROTEIN: uncharacterized protein LOC107848865 [Capsicum annuum]|uniref:LOW QUALITY PROTEIN: uncharacterized protein LOC107848865 n=1 Tax=Capsicum annuum TaxID=4072 RepID=UPI001FB04B84|nr:LOW QUALITY PROTEIN: uncharacterized protein LOC107848865 [Capsicum annuum]